MNTLTPCWIVPSGLRPHAANHWRLTLYSIARDAQLASAEDERALAARVRRGLAVQARLRTRPGSSRPSPDGRP